VLFESMAALAGTRVAAGAMAALLISEQTPLFGFMGHGHRLESVIAIGAEAIAIVSLGVFLAIADQWAHELRVRIVPRDESGGAGVTLKATEAKRCPGCTR
jgi:hypothetical protein